MSSSLLYRPRTTSEIVDAAIELLKRDYSRYVLIGALVHVPWLVAQMVIFQLAGVKLNDTSSQSWPVVMATSVVGVVVIALVSGALTHALSEAYLGRAVEPADSLRVGLRRLTPVVLSMVLRYLYAMLIATVAIFALMIPAVIIAIGMRSLLQGIDSAVVGVIAGVAAVALVAGAFLLMLTLYFPTTPVVVLEGRPTMAALRRARELTAGHRRHVLGAMVLAFGMYMLLSFGSTMLFTAMGQTVLAQAAGTAVSVFVFPALSAVVTLLYYDLRIRKEGFDLELMAEALAPEPVPEPA